MMTGTSSSMPAVRRMRTRNDMPDHDLARRACSHVGDPSIDGLAIPVPMACSGMTVENGDDSLGHDGSGISDGRAARTVPDAAA